MNHRRLIVLVSLLALLGSAVGGCAFIAWTVAAFAPPKSVPAAYKLDSDGKVLVLVDDMGKPVRYEQIKRLLTEEINRLLIDNKAAAKVVAYEDVFRLAASRTNFNSMGVSNVARALGAKQVVYVYLEEFSLKEDPNISLWQGKLGVLVRVVDIDGKVRWPTDSPSGHRPPAASTPQVDDPSPTYGRTVAEELAKSMSLRIAQLFYKHTVPR